MRLTGRGVLQVSGLATVTVDDDLILSEGGGYQSDPATTGTRARLTVGSVLITNVRSDPELGGAEECSR